MVRIVSDFGVCMTLGVFVYMYERISGPRSVMASVMLDVGGIVLVVIHDSLSKLCIIIFV